MAWSDRIKEAAYTSPSGFRLAFMFADVSRSIDKNGTAYSFPDANGTYIQDMGTSGRRFPMRLYFNGANCDLEAEAFEAALLEVGTGRLEHPVYGSRDVVPMGEITRRDDLVTGANQVIIEATLWETIGVVYPSNQGNLPGDTAAAVAAFNAAQAAEFAANANLGGALARAQFGAKYSAFVNKAADTLRTVADTQANVAKQFDGAVKSINRGVDVLVSQPLTLAFQTSIMLQAPARALSALGDRFAAYANLARSIFTPNAGPPVENNELRGRDLFASGSVAGSVVSVLNNEYRTRPEAFAAAETVLNIFAEVVAWRDATFQASDVIDTGDAHQALENAVALAAGYLVALSFGLRFERRIVLDRARSVVDLCAELYGTTWETILDEFINTNELTGDEILELPRGRSIVYYV
jgi:hypothetical protein